MNDTTRLLAELAPKGVLRAAINIGNALLAQRDDKTGALSGASVALAKEIATRNGLEVSFVVYESAGRVFNALETDEWDIAFMAHEPARAEKLNFSPPYFAIEGTYIVPTDSALKAIEEVDTKGIRIASVTNAAYDLYLKRTLKNAELVHAPASSAVLPLFRDQQLDAMAGLRPILEKTAASDPSLRVLPGHFMTIKQSIVTPKQHTEAAKYLQDFVKEAITSGFVANQFAPE
jgi:polar amino acid transport system substrate-binding protein